MGEKYHIVWCRNRYSPEARGAQISYSGHLPPKVCKEFLQRISIISIDINIIFAILANFSYSCPSYQLPVLNLCCGAGENQHQLELKTYQLMVDFPNYEGYPTSFYPLMAFHHRNHDYYMPRTLRPNYIQEKKREIRWKHASKTAELAAILIAMAQKQAERLTDNKHVKSACCPNAVCVS